MGAQMASPGRRGAEPRTPLNRDRVLLAALALADAGGIESLSMRKLGESGGMLGLIFRKAQNKIQDPAKLNRLIEMIDEALLKRITVNPDIFGGKPIVRGMRVSVELILSLLAQGEAPETILADYPDLEPDDLRACLAYAHAVIAHDKLDSVQIAG